MKNIEIEIGSKKYNVDIARSEEEKEKGLQDIDNLPDNKGMLFVFDESDEVSMWMKDTKIPLDIIFINEDLEVLSVYKGEPYSEEIISEENVVFVLEVNADSGIKKGDELEFTTDEKINKKMLVLDKDGKSQMELVGGERIFSRPNTKTLIKFAKKAKSTELDRDYHSLWSWKVDAVQTMINGVQVTGALTVFHPVANVWLERSGVAFKEFQLGKDKNDPTPENLSKKALERDVPIANAEAFKNAAKTLGNAFGRHLNRSFQFEHISDENILNDILPV